MAKSLTIKELREAVRSPECIKVDPFNVLRSIALLAAVPENQQIAHDMVLRALEHRESFGAYVNILDSLVQSTGLYPYADSESMSFKDTVAYEFHRPVNMGEDIVFHREQTEIYLRLLDGDSVILSAPTSFGKSKIIDAMIATERYKNIAVIVPTLALIDETRRRVARFSGRYKIITHLSQRPSSDSNVFVFTAERAVAYEHFPKIDFFVIDEFYKLNAMSDDTSRTVALNHSFNKLRKQGGQFYLLGPNIQSITEGIETAYRCHFYLTKFTTVASDHINIPVKGDEIERLIKLCREITEPTLIFCRSPQRVNDVANALTNADVGPKTPELQYAADWAARNYHKDWVYSKALTQGIGIHHGRLPRSLSQYVVRMFNDLKLKYLICTSTLIEGVNTKAKNVIVFDNKIAKRQIDFFTFNNIKGRSGRMFEHFVGRVYLFNEPPPEQLPFVDFPLFAQGVDTPDSLLVQLDDEDLTPSSRERMLKFQEQDILPLSIIRENAAIDPNAQLRLAKHLVDTPSLSGSLSWTGFPKYGQLLAACDLIWVYLVEQQHSGGVHSAKQLTLKLWQLANGKSSAERVLQELQGENAADNPDKAVERVLHFERTWASFEFPRYLMALSKIQRAVFEPLSLPYGDYSSYASQVECLFNNPVVAALDEYGVPMQLANKIQKHIGETTDLDDALIKLKHLDVDRLDLDGFEKEILKDAQSAL